MSLRIEEYVHLADKLLSKLKERGIEGDIYLEYTYEKSVSVQEGKIREVSEQEEVGLALRVCVKNRIGLTYINDFRNVNLDELIDKCLKIAKLNSPVKSWVGFPSGKPSSIPSLCNRALLDVELEELVRDVEQCLNAIKQDQRLFVVDAASSISYYEKMLVNTSGFEGKESGTSSYASLSLVASSEDYSTPVVWECTYSRTEKKSLLELIDKCKEEVLSLLKPKKLEVREIPVVLTHKVIAELLNYTLLQVLTARAFVLKRSPFLGKIGQKILSEKLTVIDDATLEGEYCSTSFDDEGVITRRVPIVENGVLKTVITDLYWASFLNVSPTGHGFRSSYMSTPGISYTNVIVQEGDVKLGEVLEGEEYYLLIDDVQGAHSSNPESGEFSVAAPCAWLIRKGEKVPVKNVMISGNMYSLLSQEEFHLTREIFRLPGLISPWFIFRRGVTVIS